MKCNTPLQIAMLALVFAPGGGVQAQERTPFPPFTGERVYVAGVSGSFDSVKPVIERLEKGSGQTYYVAIVNSFGKGSGAALEYVSALEREWRRQAEAKKLKLDGERSVIVAIALGDHRIAMQTGARLREKLGLRGQVLDRDLIEKKFIPLAKRNDYSQAITALLEGVDAWVREHERTAVAKTQAPPVPAPPPASRSLPSLPSGDSRVAFPPLEPQRVSHYVSPVRLGLGLGGAFLAAGVLVAFVIKRARGRAQGKLSTLMKGYRARSVEVMDRLDHLKDQLKLLPASDPDFKAPIAGETLKLYRSLEERLAKLWDQWLAAMDALEQGKKLADQAGTAFDSEALKKVEAIVDTARAFDPIDEGAAACQADYERLDQAHEAARAVAARVDEAVPRIARAIESLRALGYASTRFQGEAGELGVELGRLKGVLTPDPIGARTHFDALVALVRGVLERVERAVAIHAEAGEARNALGTLRKQVEEHRAHGLALGEDGGDPDGFLGEADEHLRLVKSALEEGDASAADRELAGARTMISRAGETIEEVKKAKAFCLIEQAARKAESDRLRGLLPAAETSLKRLSDEFAQASWGAVAQNLAQARGLAGCFDTVAGEARAAADAQRYLAARRKLEELGRRQEQAAGLLGAIDQRLAELVQAREDVQASHADLERHVAEAAALFQANVGRIGPVAEDALARAEHDRGEIETLLRAARPDWPRVRALIQTAGEEASIAADGAQGDLAAYAQLESELAQARARAGEVRGRLMSRSEDRLAANQHFEAAEAVLDQVGAAMGEPRGEQARMLEAVRGAAQDLERAEQLFREDLRLAAQAQQEIDVAARAIRKARSFVSMGVGVDCSAADAELSIAMQQFSAQEYEAAVEHAGSAIQLVRSAHNTAVQQAMWRQMQQDAEARRWQSRSGWNGAPGVDPGAFAIGAAAAILNQISQSGSAAPAQPPSIPAPPPMPTMPDPGAGAGSWTPDGGQGSW